MDSHKNARLTPKGREEMVRSVLDGGLSKAAAARQFNTSGKTVAKWVDRFRKVGMEACAIARRGLIHRPTKPHLRHAPGSRSCAASAILASRSPSEPGLSAATVSRILQRLGLNKIDAQEPCEPVRRYERERPGEMIHLDIKKLGRINGIGHRITGDRTGQRNGPGWEFVHVAIGDASPIAFAKVMNSERRRSATAFLKAALAYHESLGIKVERVMTDNGSCYNSFAFRRLCKRLGLKHIRTKPYHAENQRQGRTLHSDLSARVGLRQGLPALAPANR